MTEEKSTSAGAQSAGKLPPGGGGDEFAHIPTPRTRHPVLAIAAAALALFLIVHVRKELRYALSSGQAMNLGEATAAFSPRATPSGFDNRYVRISGTPDRESGLEVDTKGAWTFTQFFRVLGTGERLFVHRMASPLPAPLAENDVFEGRLVRFSELPFEDAVRRYFSAHVVATHFFTAEDLRAGLVAAKGPLTLRDRAGDTVTVAPDDPLVIDVRRPDEVRVGLPRERYADDAAARAEIERRGGTIVSSKGLVKVETAGADSGGFVGGGPPPTERWTYVARFPAERRQAALSALGDLDRKVEIRDARETLRVRVTDMAAADDGGLSLRPGGGSERRVPLADVAAVRTFSTVRVPDDAFLLIEGDRPQDHLPTLFLALAVAMFGAFNLAALVRELRR